jgi:hypothetical protein
VIQVIRAQGNAHFAPHLRPGQILLEGIAHFGLVISGSPQSEFDDLPVRKEQIGAPHRIVDYPRDAPD